MDYFFSFTGWAYCCVLGHVSLLGLDLFSWFNHKH